MFNNNIYNVYREAISENALPLALVDLDSFDANIRYVNSIVESSGKTIRVGSKSLRCEPLIKRIFEIGGKNFKGLMTYTAAETNWLADKGHDDFIIAYPSLQKTDLDLITSLIQKGKKVRPMVDCLEHLLLYSKLGEKAKINIELCLEIDMAYQPIKKGFPYIGVRRSPLRTPKQVLHLIQQSKSLSNIKITSVMGYEAHIAGTNDQLPGQYFRNKMKRYLKQLSNRELSQRRQIIVEALKNVGLNIEIVNGGGSGSLISTSTAPSVTEITIGSGFFCPSLFHHFADVKYQPAAFFATQVVRIPAPGIITCLGGGYTASGPASSNKLPLPVLPTGLKYLDSEGAGEVQTPLQTPSNIPLLSLGDPVFFQHAKSGELCERFSEILLIKKGKITGKALTYRGEGKTFL